MSADERLILLDTLIAAGLDPARMMPGTGCCSLTETVKLTAQAVRHGCAGVLMLPPFYYKQVSDDGLFRYFSEVVQRVSDARLRIYLYHIPPVAMVGITPQLVERLLSAYPGTIAGMKDSSGDWNNTKMFLDAFGGDRPLGARAREGEGARAGADQFDVFVGSESFLLANMRHGGAGTISAMANVNPGEIHKLHAEADRINKINRMNLVGGQQFPYRGGVGPDAIAAGRRARSVREEVVAVDDRGVETDDCDLSEGSGVGARPAAPGRVLNGTGQGTGEGNFECRFSNVDLGHAGRVPIADRDGECGKPKAAL